MNHPHYNFNPDDINLIRNALITAAQTYENDANGAAERIINQFRKQAEEARALADQID